jgi:hypothetical protein
MLSEFFAKKKWDNMTQIRPVEFSAGITGGGSRAAKHVQPALSSYRDKKKH